MSDTVAVALVTGVVAVLNGAGITLLLSIRKTVNGRTDELLDRIEVLEARLVGARQLLGHPPKVSLPRKRT